METYPDMELFIIWTSFLHLTKLMPTLILPSSYFPFWSICRIVVFRNFILCACSHADKQVVEFWNVFLVMQLCVFFWILQKQFFEFCIAIYSLVFVKIYIKVFFFVLETIFMLNSFKILFNFSINFLNSN